MGLDKCVRKGTQYLEYYCKNDEVIDEKSYVLLGFKDGSPVLANKMSDKKPTFDSKKKKTLMVEVDAKTGDKYINLNGRKLKMITEAELPLHVRHNAHLMANSGSIIPKKPVKIKIIGAIQPILSSDSTSNKIQKINKAHKPIENNTDSTNDTALSNKLSVLKNPSTDRTVQLNGKLASMNYKPCSVEYPSAYIMKQMPLCYRCSHPIEQPGYNINKRTFDTSAQTEPSLSCTEVQTDTMSFDDLISKNLIDFDMNELFSDISLIPAKNIINSSTEVPVKEVQKQQYDDKHIQFFNDLRKALVPNEHGNLPIHIGVIENDVQYVKRYCNVLKALQKNVDLVNHDDFTPLQLAIVNGSSVDIVNMLLLNKASLGVTDVDGNSILHLTVEYERKDILEIILKHVADQKIFKQYDFNINPFNEEGLTPLMICTVKNLKDCAGLLLHFEADANVKDRKSGRTALFHAAENHHVEMVQLLLNYGADTKIKNFFGTSPHDAMYEVEEIPEPIKIAIFGKTAKRKFVDETKITNKIRKKQEKKPLKTYARYQKIGEDYAFPKFTVTK